MGKGVKGRNGERGKGMVWDKVQREVGGKDAHVGIGIRVIQTACGREQTERSAKHLQVVI